MIWEPYEFMINAFIYWKSGLMKMFSGLTPKKVKLKVEFHIDF